jgi:GDPmannose 4,6-dehydratase
MRSLPYLMTVLMTLCWSRRLSCATCALTDSSSADDSVISLSFEQPVETQESIYLGTLNLLEAIRFTGKGIKLYNACSSECFGDLQGSAATEETAFRPRSPYAVAKSAAFWQVANYREAYNIFACSGILFNHESPLRPERFVSQKIVRAACRIARGAQEKLPLRDTESTLEGELSPETKFLPDSRIT